MSSPSLIEEATPSNLNDDAQSPLLPASEAAAMFKVGVRTWRTWHATGKIPQPIRIGRKVFWRLDELRAWVAAGCPDRETWAILQR